MNEGEVREGGRWRRDVKKIWHGRILDLEKDRGRKRRRKAEEERDAERQREI